MTALLLSAGLGTRLQPITNYIPKCLVPINGKPLLEYWLENLSYAGVKQFIVNTHYFADMVVDYISTSKYKDNIIISYENELLLTGGTILNNKQYLQNGSFMVVHADNLSFCDFSAFIQAHHNRPSYCDITMMTFTTDKPQTCGIVCLNERNVVQNFFEKVQNPPTNLANGAVYIMEPSIIKYLETFNKKHIDISLEVLPHFINKIYTFHNNIYHRDIGTLESYAISQIDILNYIDNTLIESRRQ